MTDQPTNCITLNSPPTEEILRLDKEGFHYKGEFIADAGEAHRLMVEFLKQPTPQPVPVAPTDEELLKLLSRASGLPDYDTNIDDGGRIMSEPNELLAYARAVLARYGTPANTTREEN